MRKHTDVEGVNVMGSHTKTESCGQEMNAAGGRVRLSQGMSSLLVIHYKVVSPDDENGLRRLYLYMFVYI